ALAAGCTAVRPCAEVEEAKALADEMRAGRVLLAGERGGLPLPGFDLGNSPRRFTCRTCRGVTLVLTTTNGTRALLRCAGAARTLSAACHKYGAAGDHRRPGRRPVCTAGAAPAGDVPREHPLRAGARVDPLPAPGGARLNDGARLAWDCFETHGRCLRGA